MTAREQREHHRYEGVAGCFLSKQWPILPSPELDVAGRSELKFS